MRFSDLDIVEPVYTNYPPSSLLKFSKPREYSGELFEKLTKKMTFYIHIPFCKSKCHYCQLLSFVPDSSNIINKYVKALIKEMSLLSRITKACSSSVEVLYFGGGTPSVLSSQQFEQIISSIRNEFHLNADCEITVECHPATLTKSKLEKMHSLGINRLSIGVQSLNPKVLSACGRSNSYMLVERIFRYAEKTGFDNVSFDVMWGLPKQTIATLNDTCNKLLDLRPQQISIYVLTLAEKSQLYHAHLKDKGILPNKKFKSKMYDFIFHKLETSGYKAYTVNNFTPNREHLSRYMANNWTSEIDRMGFGLGSYSFVNMRQYQNYSEIGDYFASIETNKLPIRTYQPLSAEESVRRKIVFALQNILVPKKGVGIDVDGAFSETLASLERLGFIDNNPYEIKLTYDGIKYLYYVQREFFSKNVKRALNRLKMLK